MLLEKKGIVIREEVLQAIKEMMEEGSYFRRYLKHIKLSNSLYYPVSILLNFFPCESKVKSSILYGKL